MFLIEQLAIPEAWKTKKHLESISKSLISPTRQLHNQAYDYIYNEQGIMTFSGCFTFDSSQENLEFKTASLNDIFDTPSISEQFKEAFSTSYRRYTHDLCDPIAPKSYFF